MGAALLGVIEPATLTAWGLPGLFLAAFAAGSVLPFPSEGVLAALLLGGAPAWAAVFVATAGNVLGAWTLFWLGRGLAAGSQRVAVRWLARRSRTQGAALARARQRLLRWGPPLLLLTWVPFFGDALVLAAGLLGLRTGAFLGWTTLGKALRFVAVAAWVSSAVG